MTERAKSATPAAEPPVSRPTRETFVSDDQVPTHVEYLGVGRVNRKTQVPFSVEQRAQFASFNAERFATKAANGEEGHAYVAITNQQQQMLQVKLACVALRPVVLDVAFNFTDRETGDEKTGHKWAIVAGRGLDEFASLRALNISVSTDVWAPKAKDS